MKIPISIYGGRIQFLAEVITPNRVEVELPSSAPDLVLINRNQKWVFAPGVTETIARRNILEAWKEYAHAHITPD